MDREQLELLSFLRENFHAIETYLLSQVISREAKEGMFEFHSREEEAKLQELAEKKKRRLERNRASARECRKRKKEKKQLLSQELARLEADNLQLRLKLQIGREDRRDDQSSVITSKLNEMLSEGASEVEVLQKIQELKERFSDYGRDRRSAIDFHVAQLRRCLQPTQTTKAILWLMSLARQIHEHQAAKGQRIFAQTDSSSSTSSSNTPRGSSMPASIPTDYFTNFPAMEPRFDALLAQDTTVQAEYANFQKKWEELQDLWKNLVQEVKPTADQQFLMVSYTKPDDQASDPFLQIESVTENCDKKLDRIVEIICNKNDCLDNEMASIQSILSPRQIAKFIIWIDRNPVCMQMLEALWPHLTVNSANSKPLTAAETGHLVIAASTTTGSGSDRSQTSPRAGKKMRSSTSSSNFTQHSKHNSLMSSIPVVKTESMDLDVDDYDSSYSSEDS